MLPGCYKNVGSERSNKTDKHQSKHTNSYIKKKHNFAVQQENTARNLLQQCKTICFLANMDTTK
jgi:hypothetical protein